MARGRLAGDCQAATLAATLFLRGEALAKATGSSFVDLAADIELWSPQQPTLYVAELALCRRSACDEATFRFGLRWLSKSHGQGQEEVALLLNGEALLQNGVLYQGYWPQSLIAPPGPEALRSELKEIKRLGFNLVRVHATVLPALFYYICDEEGLLVWQDFPAGDGRALPLWDSARGMEQTASPLELDEIQRTPESAENFWQELQATISWLKSFACIVCWIPFNEGWGQFRSMESVQWLRQFGGDRWINMASGWNDVADLFPGMDGGDIVDAHNYEVPPYDGLRSTFTQWPLPLAGRALALGEYGGLGFPLEGHEWLPETSWAYGNVSLTAEDFGRQLLALGSRLAELLCESRISTLVYTQWNDIEEEVNGLVTYDRVAKLPWSTILEFNSRLNEA
ncbi:unnamed protein product [Effrenium voratum]|nr:unnamed protein product [Effrenium voratum]